jgi:heat shock protein HtpX
MKTILINTLKTAVLLSALFGLALFIGSFFGTLGLTIAFILSIGFNVAMYFFSDKIVLTMYRAKPASKTTHAHLIDLVESIAQKAQIPAPKVYIVPSDQPNAFATGRNPQNGVVACTTGILTLLTHKELAGVIAHEIAHIKNRDVLIATISACFAGIISYTAQLLAFVPLFGGDRDSPNPLVFLALSILAPILAVIIQLAISRSREYVADASAATYLKDSSGLSGALQKLEQYAKRIPMKVGNDSTAALCIVSPLSGSDVFSWFSTHPSTQKRVAKLDAMKF